LRITRGEFLGSAVAHRTAMNNGRFREDIRDSFAASAPEKDFSVMDVVSCYPGGAERTSATLKGGATFKPKRDALKRILHPYTAA